MSLRCLVIGDPHFTPTNTADVDLFLAKLGPAVRRLQPDFIVCLGDLLDRHEQIHLDPLLRATQFIELLATYAPTFLLVGNHDRRNNTDFLTHDHPFTALRHCPQVYIVDQALKTEVISRKDDKVRGNFLFIPYVEPGRFEEALDTLELPELADEGGWRSSSIDAIFAHQEFYGVQLGARKSTLGDKWEANYPLVISGHIHDYQRLQSNIIYVGTPFQHAYSEAPNKAIMLFNFNVQAGEEAEPLEEVLTLEGLEPTSRVRAKAVRIQSFVSIKRTVHLSASEVSKYQAREGEKVKLVVTGTAEELKALNKTKIGAKLAQSGIKVSLKPQIDSRNDDATHDSAKASSNFLELYREAVGQEPELLGVFDELFGKMQ